jgi:FSR family fosmidomycin resistance protein-like MFS transporter
MATIPVQRAARLLRRPALFVLMLLVVEFLDEFVFGAREAAWPLVRSDLQLSYEQIGLLLSLPSIIGYFIEPLLGILGDVWQRRLLIIGGALLFTLALALTAISHSLLTLMAAFILFSPSSGAFVGLSQSSLMDIDPTRHEQNMTRWTFAGSVGVVTGALAMGILVALGGTWRQFYALAALLSLIIVLIVRRYSFAAPKSDSDEDVEPGLIDGIRLGLQALRRPAVLRWLLLLEFGDLMLDVLYGYLALYFVDVVGVSEVQAGVAVAVWTIIGLIGSLLMIPLLERVRGLRYLKISAWLELGLFIAFLLIPGFVPKLIVLTLIGLFNAGWYSILKGQLYSAMPGQSGTVMAVSSISGFIGSAIPFCIGLAADHLGLNVAMGLLILGPIMLLIGLPRRKANE